MLYHLFEALKEYDIPGQGLMSYLTFRAMMAGVTAMVISLIIGKRIIRWLQKKQIGEEIRDLGLEGQMQKKGTPTMGGIIIFIAIMVSVLLFADLTNIYTVILLFTTIWFAGLGFADDYIKVFRHNKEGLSEKAKLMGQIVFGLGLGLTVCFSPDIVVREKIQMEDGAARESTRTETVLQDGRNTAATGVQASQTLDIDTEFKVKSGEWKEEDVVKSTKTTLPFIKNHEFDYKWLSPFKGTFGWYCKWAIYVLMIVLVITACSNGTNLTDGMDGLTTGTSTIVVVVLGIFAYLSGNIINAQYLNIMYIPGTGEIGVFMAAFAGALIGFLWHNSYPAQVFMGDTGSLMIGGLIGVCAILIRKELLLPILCGVFFVETLSVMIQRSYFKYTKKRYGAGRRVFKMTPLHHHFQKEGVQAVIMKPARALPEAKIVVRFWIVGVILAVLTVALLKVR